MQTECINALLHDCTDQLHKNLTITMAVVLMQQTKHCSVLHAVAVDVNPAENALLELKIAAIKHLSYEDYLLVLGDKEDTMQKR